MTDTSIPFLQPHCVFGLRTDIQGNINFVSDEGVLYPVGGLLAIHNFAEKKQTFAKLPDRGRQVNQIIVSPNQKLIILTERGDRPTVYFYDVNTFRKKKQIQIPVDKDSGVRDIVAVQFTFDSRNLVVVSGEPEYMMYVYKCDKAKMHSSAKGNNLNGTGTVVQIACNPNDANQLALVGKQVFKIMACSDASWRQFGYNKTENLNCTCAAWMTQDRLVVGTNDGKLMIFESGELKLAYWAGDLPIINFKPKERDDIQQSSQTNISIPSAGNVTIGEDSAIRFLTFFPKGMVFAYLTGQVHLYEPETPHRYKKRNIFKVPNNKIVRAEVDEEFRMDEINCLCVCPTQERLLLTCQRNQIFQVKLWGPEMQLNIDIMFYELGLSLHHGCIGGMDTCQWKPIFITSGEWDRTLRVWNYETEVLELCKQFQEDIHGVALHPSGLYTIVGFSDKLRFLAITIEDFTIMREFPIRNCRECSFSNMGQYFAATNGNLIQVYSTTNLENLFNLKGHSGKIHSMSWIKSDFKMTSCGSDGAVYEWDIITNKRVAETIVKSCRFNGVRTTTDGKSNFVVGSDGCVREIMNAAIHKEISVCPTGLDTMCLAQSDQMLFVTGDEGTIYSVKIPILDAGEFLEFPGHSATIIRMVLSYDDRLLITSSSDGVICIWRLKYIEGKTVFIDKEFTPSTDVLISREDLQEKLSIIHNLQLRMHELVAEQSYQLRNIETLHGIKMKEVHEAYCVAIEELKEKNENLETDHAQEINDLGIQMMNIKQEHERFIQRLEITYNDKLIIEYEKYLQLEDKMANMRKRYETELSDLRESKKTSEESIINDFVQKLHEKDVQVEEMEEEAHAKSKQHEMIKQQIEDDADREIYELKTAHEKELKTEQDSNVKLRGETGIIKKKLTTSQKECDELKQSVYNLQSEHHKFKGVILGLEKDIADLRKEIEERDTAILDKEKRIYELKRKNQELEKFRFILNFKITELNSQIEPRDRQIREQTEQITDMVNELENLQKVIVGLDIQLMELREKLSAADNELKREVSKNRAAKAALQTIRTDLHHMSGLIQDVPKLTRTLREMYHKYNADKDFAITQAEDTEVKNEFLRQRDFLERTIKTLHNQVVKSSSTGGGDKVRLIEENVSLITETNHLRKDLKEEILTNKKMQALFGISAKYMGAKQAKKKLNDAVSTAENIHEEYKLRLQENEKVVDALKEENERLTSKIIGGEELFQASTDLDEKN